MTFSAHISKASCTREAHCANKLGNVECTYLSPTCTDIFSQGSDDILHGPWVHLNSRNAVSALLKKGSWRFVFFFLPLHHFQNIAASFPTENTDQCRVWQRAKGHVQRSTCWGLRHDGSPRQHGWRRNTTAVLCPLHLLHHFAKQSMPWSCRLKDKKKKLPWWSFYFFQVSKFIFPLWRVFEVFHSWAE